MKRGTRIVTGYVVRLAKDRWAEGMRVTHYLSEADRFAVQEHAIGCAMFWRETAEPKWPNARVLPVVRYELDREEERLRDAVVEAAERWEIVGRVASTESDELLGASKQIWLAVRALRAHLEKSK